MNMPKVLISDNLSKVAVDVFTNNKIEVDVKTDLTVEELKKEIINYEGLVVRSATKVNQEIIECGKNLKIIGRAGAGVDNIDVIFANKKNIIVMNTPGGNTNATAEHTFSLILSLYRNIPEANNTTHKGLWEKKKFKGLELKDKNITLIGFGNVAQRVAKIAMGFNMKIFVISKSFESRKDFFPNIQCITKDKMLEISDIISFHCKPPKDGHPLINLADIKKMKNNAIIINTARGNLVDENNLKLALDESLLRGAAIDVFSNEPAKNNVLFGTKNLILTPHIAASTEEAQIVVAKQIAEQISDFFIKNKIINEVTA
tara:strand:+ start:593 stop:1540 length:948 start_codon:yes stop_codon:yes gene_type:complete